MSNRKKAVLSLEDGTRLEGWAFGAETSTVGEVVFNTAIVGYPESLTDPSYAGQILVMTYPSVGNYGVPAGGSDPNGLPEHFESRRIQVRGLVVGDLSEQYSHWSACESLDEWMRREGVPGITGIDTRLLTKLIRDKGAMKGRIIIDDKAGEAPEEYGSVNWVSVVSCDNIERYEPACNAIGKTIAVVDCGVKANIIRCLLQRGYSVVRVPWDYDFNTLEFDALFLSNGPGNPEMCQPLVDNIRKFLESEHVRPCMGICLGHQLLSKAVGARTYKLPYGHRGHNQPVRLEGTTRCYITSQNHGYAVDVTDLSDDWQPLFTNMNDGSNEGIRHRSKPWFGVQFHPEACSGPLDTDWLFDVFSRTIQGEDLDFGDALPQGAPKKLGKVLLLGSGALKIGEAGEFDYSGSQALKALKEEGVKTVLINPNIATVQTSEGVADRVYFLPVTPFFVEKVIAKERPDGILLAFGGQTALNCGVELYKSGVLEKYGVEVLGTPVQTIIDTEDRDLFVKQLDSIDVKTIRSRACADVEQAKAAAAELGYPVILRAAYALGGLGSGFCDNAEELESLADKAFAYSNQVLVEKSLKGWKEIEYEVVRDRYDNCITVCNMENFDPLGIHTGESIVVAPSQTLTDRDYHKLRTLAIRIVRHLGIVGECNVQYAYDPQSEDYRVIEVNARLSRSSALASKATGYPLAFVAAKLALGYGLFELQNSVTLSTPAFFEPALDYLVCKIPRWDLSKFHGVDRQLGSSMKSVGEVMAIGRTFEEAVQKGLRMIGQGMHGFVGNHELKIEDVDKALCSPTDDRIFVIEKAFGSGYTIDRIHQLTMIDNWFLHKLHHIHDIWGSMPDTVGPLMERFLAAGEADASGADGLGCAKVYGFTDFQIARALGLEKSVKDSSLMVRQLRKVLGIVPVTKQIDTLAAEFPAKTNYLYLTYGGVGNDLKPDDRSVVVLGSGAYRIGSSVEFDWCGVQGLQTIRERGYTSVMINYNPETVSTDYDMCDRLYFDELSFERVMDIIENETPEGVIVSTGGQIPNNLAVRLHNMGVRILGTQAASIDNAEDRDKFSAMLDRIGVDQPQWSALTDMESVKEFVERVGFPVLVRPSYVLSGAAMNVCSNMDELTRFLRLAASVSKEHPVVVSKFMQDTKEVEMDAVARDGEIIAYAISEHIEFAGVHSGDATICFPAQKLYVETVRRIKKISGRIAKELNISGPFNIQYLAKDNEIKVIECNLRASRSFPFVSKVLKLNLIKLATDIMLGVPVEKPSKNIFDFDYVGIKSSQFSFNRLRNSDPVLGVDMSSTGEVGCLGEDTQCALLKSMLSVGQQVPQGGVLMSTGTAKQKASMLDAARTLIAHGYKIYATGGTSRYLSSNGVDNTMVGWPDQTDGAPQALDLMHERKIGLVVNIPKDLTVHELTNGYKIRRAAVDLNIPLITNARLADAFIRAFCNIPVDHLEIKAWDEYN